MDVVDNENYTISLNGNIITVTIENAAAGTYSIASAGKYTVYAQSVSITPQQSYVVKETE